MYGGGFDMLAALAAKILPFDLFETRRLSARRSACSGSSPRGGSAGASAARVGGLIALLLLATCPLYYGHMFMNPKDAPFAVAMALLLLGLVRAFDEYPRPTAATIVLFGIGLGLTIGTRIIGGMAALYAAAAAALLVAVMKRARSGCAPRPKRLGRFVLALLPGLVLAYAVMGLVWPWAVVDPLNPFRSLEYFSVFFEKPWQELFAGALIAGARHAAQLCADAVRAADAGNLPGARARRHRAGRHGGGAPAASRYRGAPCCCS